MSARAGVVYLVGAGPGDKGLMTARSLELIASADAILYDRLIPEGALDGARADAELVYVGKKPGDAVVLKEGAAPQTGIEEALVERAKRGLSVVRLKGGDPFVFGRGGEEAESLREAGIEFEVVPGVTSGIAASAYAGIPVTYREDASAVAFITGHEDPEKPETAIDWDALARFPGTLVMYMGVKNLPRISEQLAAAGRDPSEPAAAIERGTMPGQRSVVATLETLPDVVAKAGLKAPSILLFGKVAARSGAIAWLERRPLHGKRVVVTRARAQSGGIASSLRELGAEVVPLPSIRVESRIDSGEVRDAIEALHSYALVCVSSPNAVRALFEAMHAGGRDARALAQAQVAAVGPSTAAELERHGVIADVIPQKAVAEELAKALQSLQLDDRPVLIARASEARDVLPDALRERGAKVDVVSFYETVRETLEGEELERASGADYITFTSSSTVANLLAAMDGKLPPGARLASIGPITSETIREAGLTVDIEATEHTPDGLVAALVADAARD